MSNHLFKPLGAFLSNQEEVEVTQKLADAYRKTLESEQKPQFQRIAEVIRKNLVDQTREKQSRDGQR